MNITLLLEDFCMEAKHLRGITDQTLKRYRQNIMNFCRSENITEIEEINQEKVYRFFLEGRANKTWKVVTYQTYHMSLRVFFRWCIDRGHIIENYADKIAVPKKEKLLPKRLKKDEAYRLLDIAFNMPYTQEYERYRNHALLSIFIYAGLRKNEALGLHMQDVDIENLSIFVRRGKGNKDRILPMSITLAHSLSRYKQERLKAKKTCAEFFHLIKS